MPTTVLSTFSINHLTALFRLDEASGRVGLELFPTALAAEIVTPRDNLIGQREIDALPFPAPPARAIDPLVHLKIVGDPYPGSFAQGRSMREASSINSFRYQRQDVSEDGSLTRVVTTLQSEAGHRVEHHLSWYDGDHAVQVMTRFANEAAQPVTLEMLSSFSLGGITPFHAADAPHRLRVHRFRSAWGAEGRLSSQSIEELHLERSWAGFSVSTERFGQVGSMPVRGWFPFVAVEDTAVGVLWGAQLAWAGSWQMEIFRQHDPVCISGGLADREFGHWTKTLKPGEWLETPPATLACVAGNLDELCASLTAVQERAAETHPAVEADLPIIFNEFCTTWGDPGHEKVSAIARRLAGTPVRYLVIDAGWYKGESGNWWSAHGDWVPGRGLFPEGLEVTTAAIREQGLIPGLWFEMETCGEESAVFARAEHLLMRDGFPVTSGGRRFWDLTDPKAVEYLSERVIDQLERYGFGYMKVDYNDTIGIGAQVAAGGADDSLGEGLRLHIQGVYRFFERIRERLPNLVIENCSSGGHRLEPSMIGHTAMSSFSDAHELDEIPIIAASLHRLMLPRQSQIWAVLHPSDSDQRLVYSLAATFLGRMCLSGDVLNLSESQWSLAQRAMEFYARCAPVIKSGQSHLLGEVGPSWRHPEGWQGVVRYSSDGQKALVVLHAFANAPETADVQLQGDNWAIEAHFDADFTGTIKAGKTVHWPIAADFSAAGVLLTRE